MIGRDFCLYSESMRLCICDISGRALEALSTVPVCPVMARFFRSENESQYSRVLCVNSVNYVPTLPTLFRVTDNATQLTLFYYPFAEGKKG